MTAPHLRRPIKVPNPHVDETVQIPASGSDQWLFRLRIGGYSIRAWDTYLTGPHGRSICGIVATRNGKIVFLTDRWSPPPLHSIDGKEAKADAVAWVAHYLDDESLECERLGRFGGCE
jgi:hypothetical protein